MSAGVRSWWGWGEVAAAVTAEELDRLAGLVSLQWGAPTLAASLPASSVTLPACRVRIPSALAGLASDRHEDRLRHAHGQAFRDVAEAFVGRIPSAPDLVVRPRDASEVTAVLDWASDGDIAVVPFGGGTSVVGGVRPPDGPTVSVDLERMSAVLEVDHLSRAARIQAGATGPVLQQALKAHGLTLRHYPQSWEMSTLGGWLATRAGGHFATRLTHIDDFVEAISAVTPAGTWESRRLPGSGAGPSPDRLLLGSEGTLGIITDAWLRVQSPVAHRARADVTFPTFAAGAAAVRAIVQAGLDPADCRLLDPIEAALAGAGDGSVAVLVLGFESADHPLDAWIERAVALARDAGGTCAGWTASGASRGSDGDASASGAWKRTFLRAPYLRDGLVRLGMVAETFETATTWDRLDETVEALAEVARAAVRQVCGRDGVVGTRITHAYPDGAAPYLTVIAPSAVGDQARTWDEIKTAVSEEILRLGATITHHHAVGRDHVPWYQRQRPEPFGAALAAAKHALDPAGVMNPGVLGL